jgi:methylenetetrahydrofolate dehydrogenase (NADP+)/methenyltetrahydrofolate cyclohydrolase
MIKIINGRSIAGKIRYNLKNKIAKLKKKPGLAIIMVGKNHASEVYVRLKEKAAREIGMNFRKYLLPANIKLIQLIKLIERLNRDKKINGIVVQFPLPKHLDEDRIVEAINPKKDVDGFHPANVALLEKGRPTIIPGVLAGILRLLVSTKVSLKNKRAVILSNARVFAEPLAFLLEQKRLKTKIIYPPFHGIKKSLRLADIVISAVGRPHLINGQMIKDGAILIDVGFSRVGGKVAGDFDFASCAKKAGYITPVPGGVGPMTVAMLLFNVLKAYEIQH